MGPGFKSQRGHSKKPLKNLKTPAKTGVFYFAIQLTIVQICLVFISLAQDISETLAQLDGLFSPTLASGFLMGVP